MSIIDKALGALTPPESEAARADAHRKAREAASRGDWLSLALDHHDRIRAGFEACRCAQPGPPRIEAMKRLALVFVGHSQAEEIVLYPALAKAGEKAHATQAYTEQVTAKMQMAELERIDPTGQPWLDKLEHIRGAVLHHMYEEEKSWFLELKDRYDDQGFLTQRFQEEFERYADGAAQGAVAEARSFAPGGGPGAGPVSPH
jgi:hypothetical protein